jgi:hypothetical protein
VGNVIEPEPLTLIELVDGVVLPTAKYSVLLLEKLPPVTVRLLALPDNHVLLAPTDTVPPDCVNVALPPLSSAT